MLRRLVLLATLAASAQAQGGFVFDMPKDGAAPSDYLPAFADAPIGPGDAISAADGHFVRGGQPIRFWGVNLTSDGAFPSATDASAVARRLRLLGFNLVRFHHIDNPWSSTGSLFGGMPTTRAFNASALDRLERFIAELAVNGVYVNMNLNVSRTFRESDGVADADELPELGKAVTLFDPQLIALQKEYARALLTHVNPYTGRALVDEPALAMVEVVNENSLYEKWRHGALVARAEGGELPERHARMLDSLWNTVLADRYGSTDALRAAWGDGTSDARATVGDFEGSAVAPWQTEQQGGAQVSATLDATDAYVGGQSVRVDVSAVSGTNWHAQFKRPGLSVTADSTYLVTFAARADHARTVDLALLLDRDPWTYYGGAPVDLTTEWQTFAASVKASETVAGALRLSFSVGDETGSVWVDDVAFGLAPTVGLGEGERLEDRSVRRTPFAERTVSRARLRDQVGFYIDLQTTFFAEMRTFLRDTLGVRAPITGTNWNVGLPDLASQATMDYTDNHAYWDHPEFPSVPWSPTDWRIRNEPMVTASGGTIPELFGGVRVEGKPLTVSEYNHGFPNRYRAEGPLFLAAYGSLHDADGLMLFDYGGPPWDVNRIESYFAIRRDPTVMALMPSLARAYRAGLIAPAEQTVALAYTAAEVREAPAAVASATDWRDPLPFPRTLPLRHGVVTRAFDAAQGEAPPAESPPAGPIATDTGEIVWDSGGVLQVGTPTFAALTGLPDRLAGSLLGPATVTSASRHATVTWLALDGAPLADARRSLLTLSTSAENTGMIWDGDRTVHDDWGTAPVVVRPVRLVLDAGLRADSLRLVPLDPAGTPTGAALVLAPDADGGFEIVLDQSAHPTLWFGLERLGDGGAVAAEDDPLPAALALRALAPNPARDQIRLTVGVPAARAVRVTVVDVLGRRVREVTLDARPGWTSHPLDLAGLASGAYVVVLDDGRARVTARLTVP